MTEGKAQIEFVAEFPIDSVVVEKEPLRSLMQERQFEELRGSIREHGVLVPIQVARDGENYRLVAGLRRLRACISLGLAVIPALVSFLLLSPVLPLLSGEFFVMSSSAGPA